MPFPDELARGLAVVIYDPGWPAEFLALASRVKVALGPMAVRAELTFSGNITETGTDSCRLTHTPAALMPADREPGRAARGSCRGPARAWCLA